METVVAAGLLHDVLEDTAVTANELRRAFGDAVADMVATCTEPKGRWEQRKSHLIHVLRDAPLAVKLVAAADKYHNLSHTLRHKERQDPPVWERFSRGPQQQAWFYRAVTESILANVEDPGRYPIFAQLAAAVESLFDGIPSQPPETESVKRDV